jgi:hypothetical protein
MAYDIVKNCVGRPENRALKPKVHDQSRPAQPVGIAFAIPGHEVLEKIADASRQAMKLRIRALFDWILRERFQGSTN